MKLTSKAVAALMLPRGKTDAIFFDDDLPGFGCRLRQSGDRVGRSWVAQYRHSGQTRRMMLGSVAVLSAEQARDHAKKILARVALGEDPQLERKRRAASDRHTFKALVESYLAAKEGAVRPRTLSEAKRYLEEGYFKELHNKPVDLIVRKDVAGCILEIARKHGPVAASRARAAVSALFTWAMKAGIAETNPIIGTDKPKAPPSRSRVLSDQELVAIWTATEDETDDFNRIVRLLITTGQRRSEVGGIAWTELLDIDGGPRPRWIIPGSRAKNGHEHEVPLGSLALDVIRSVPQVVGRDLMFGARTDRGFTSWNEHKKSLDERLGDQVRPWVLHDLRRTLATGLCSLGTEPHVVEELLNHRAHRAGVAGIYNRSRYRGAVQSAVSLWDRHIRDLVEGRDERNVIPIRGASNSS